MEKHFVTYNQALALKELGYVEYSWFGSECSLYKPNGKHTFYMNGIGDNTYISAPLKSQVFEWFREKHNFIGVVGLFSISDQGISSFEFHVDKIHYIGPSNFQEFVGFKTYGEAESACIDKLIELVKGQ
jgi:hypothetical protein